MTDFQTIHYSVSANGQIGTLTIDRPEALNALSTQVLSELEIVIDQIAQERTCASSSSQEPDAPSLRGLT